MYYRQPRYFKDFRCIGGACSYSCCIGWSITWSREEIDLVKNAPGCSPVIKALCENVFEYNETLKKYIVICENKRCPFLTEDNFCRIQRELGEEYLSHTCKTYPRHYFVTFNAVYRSCVMTCREIMNFILNNDRAMDLVNIGVKQKHFITASYDTDEDMKIHPELKFREDIFEFFYETIGEKNRAVEDSLVLGALAAQSLTRLVEQGELDRIPEALRSFRKQYHNPEQLRSITNIKPRYSVKLAMLGELFKALSAASSFPDVTVTLVDGEGKYNIDLYTSGEKQLNEKIGGNTFYMRNIALALLLELKIPFDLKDRTIFENYSVFAVAFALFKLNTIAISELRDRLPGEIKEEFDLMEYIARSAVMISRSISHNSGNRETIIKLLAQNGMTTPAYLALLVK